MGKRYLPVVLRGRSFRMYQDDLKLVKCIKKVHRPSIPSFHKAAQHNRIEEADVFLKKMESQSQQTGQCFSEQQ